MTATLIQIDGYDPVAAASVTLYLTNENDDRVCGLNGQAWWPVLWRAPQLRYDLVDASLSGRIDTPATDIELFTEPWPNFGRYQLADARVQIWTGEPGTAWGSYTQRADMRATGQPRFASGRATLPIAVDDRWLDVPLLTTYAGTGGVEGGSALKGTVKPLALGSPRFVPGVMVDATHNVVQVSGYGAINSVDVAFERAIRFGAVQADYASYSALVAATIRAGAWGTCKAAGLVRHGAPPVGKLSYHVGGDANGGFVSSPGSVIRRILDKVGQIAKYSSADATALNNVRGYPISVYYDQQITVREAIQRICASLNCAMGVSWMGKFFVANFPTIGGTANRSLDATGASLPIIAKLEQIPKDPAYWRLAIQAVRTWGVHSLAEAGLGDGSPDLSVPAKIDVEQDSDGNTTTTLPITFRTKALRGTVDYSPLSSFTVTFPPGITGSINDTANSTSRGIVTLSSVDDGGVVTVTANIPNYGPVTRSVAVNVTVSPPATSTPTSGGGGGTGPSSVSTTTFTSITGTTHAAITTPMQIKASASGTLTYSGYIHHRSTTGAPAIKAQYGSSSTGPWSDFAAEVVGSVASVDPDFGFTSPQLVRLGTGTKTGLTANADYWVQMVGRRASGSGTISLSGNNFYVSQ